MPAMTTPFDSNMKVDHGFLAQHAAWQLGNGCEGLIMLGSMGEGATLEHEENIAILKTAIRVAGKAPVVASISSLSTDRAVQLAKEAEDVGCSGLMVLLPYVYASDWYEMKRHVSTVIGATKLECMLYNNPVAYRTDFLPDEIAELAAEHPNLAAVKEIKYGCTTRRGHPRGARRPAKRLRWCRRCHRGSYQYRCSRMGRRSC